MTAALVGVTTAAGVGEAGAAAAPATAGFLAAMEMVRLGEATATGVPGAATGVPGATTAAVSAGGATAAAAGAVVEVATGVEGAAAVTAVGAAAVVTAAGTVAAVAAGLEIVTLVVLACAVALVASAGEAAGAVATEDAAVVPALVALVAAVGVTATAGATAAGFGLCLSAMGTRVWLRRACASCNFCSQCPPRSPHRSILHSKQWLSAALAPPHDWHTAPVGAVGRAEGKPRAAREAMAASFRDSGTR